VNRNGYIVRKGNRTIYPTSDMSVIVRAETADGIVGWGETYGIVAPGAVLAILRDVLFPFVEGRDPRDVRQIYDDLYDMQRVRGASGGYYGDALAAIDIALWDLVAKDAGVPLYEALGGKRVDKIPAYVSGCPRRRSTSAWNWRPSGSPRDSAASSTRRSCRTKASSRRCARSARRSDPTST
jgi:galactonate dehydratase